MFICECNKNHNSYGIWWKMCGCNYCIFNQSDGSSVIRFRLGEYKSFYYSTYRDDILIDNFDNNAGCFGADTGFLGRIGKGKSLDFYINYLMKLKDNLEFL